MEEITKKFEDDYDFTEALLFIRKSFNFTLFALVAILVLFICYGTGTMRIRIYRTLLCLAVGIPFILTLKAIVISRFEQTKHLRQIRDEVKALREDLTKELANAKP